MKYQEDYDLVQSFISSGAKQNEFYDFILTLSKKIIRKYIIPTEEELLDFSHEILIFMISDRREFIIKYNGKSASLKTYLYPTMRNKFIEILQGQKLRMEDLENIEENSRFNVIKIVRNPDELKHFLTVNYPFLSEKQIALLVLSSNGFDYFQIGQMLGYEGSENYLRVRVCRELNKAINKIKRREKV